MNWPDDQLQPLDWCHTLDPTAFCAVLAMQVPYRTQTSEVTMDVLLAEQSSTDPVRPVSSGPRTLVVDGLAVAAVASDPGRLSTLSGSAGPGNSLFELLASLSNGAMQCVLVIEARGGRTTSFAIDRGSLVGAASSSSLGRVSPFARELRERFGLGSYDGWTDLFLQERFYAALPMLSIPGSRMTVLQGDAHWLEPRSSTGINLQFALMEHARREDESRVLCESFAGHRGREYVLVDAEAGKTSELAKLDPHEIDLVAACVMKSCRTPMTVGALLERIPVGQFRILEALRKLLETRRIQASASEAPSRASQGRVVPLPSKPVSSSRAPARPSNPYAYVGRRVDVVRTTLVAPGAEVRPPRRKK